MKKIFYATIALAASVAMVSCQKGDGNINASIVGTWESVSAEMSAQDKDGKTVSLADALKALAKEMDLPDDIANKMAEESANAISSSFAGKVKYTFEANGALKVESIEDDVDAEFEEGSGSYKLEGNKLTITGTAEGKSVSITMNVISLTATELKLQYDANSALGGIDPDATRMLNGYNLIITQSFKRL